MGKRSTVGFHRLHLAIWDAILVPGLVHFSTSQVQAFGEEFPFWEPWKAWFRLVLVVLIAFRCAMV